MKVHSILLTATLAMSVIMSSVSVKAMTMEEQDQQAEIFMDSYIEEFADAVNMEQMTFQTSYPLSTANVDDRCVALMDGKLIAGPVGNTIAGMFYENTKALHKNPKALDNVDETQKYKIFDNLYKGGSVETKYCPQYKHMSPKERSIVWVFILTAMAHFESNCKTTATNGGGPNGTAYGYFQLHRGKEQNYDGDKGVCQKGDAGKPVAASKCTFAMLEKQFEVRSGELFSPKSYWDVLRPTGSSQKYSVIRKALMRSSLCNPKTI